MPGAVGLTHKLHRSRLGPPKATSRDRSFRGSPPDDGTATEESRSVDRPGRLWYRIFVDQLSDDLPFDKIEIDNSFIKDVLHRSDCKAVVASTLALARGLGIVTAAEGVEAEEELEYMRAAGLDLAQGYLFGRPVPIPEIGKQTAAVLAALVA
jgi:EAL domain